MRGLKRAEDRRPQRPVKANTEQVLGPVAAPTKTDTIEPKWQRHYDILLDLRTHFLAENALLKQDALEEYTGPRRNEADVATNTYDRDWALGMLSSEQDAVYEIDEALERIRNGTYGICEMTGQPIPMERLNAIPWTRFTAEAERDLEKNGEMERRKAKLGDREALPRERAPESYGKE